MWKIILKVEAQTQDVEIHPECAATLTIDQWIETSYEHQVPIMQVRRSVFVWQILQTETSLLQHQTQEPLEIDHNLAQLNPIPENTNQKLIEISSILVDVAAKSKRPREL